ncbi:hypothetical protein [Seonamhaeicola sp.]|uniref:hypothetical protein n=1 Tax=Seonamhaeicola sp. TaxID=1912245 RepID=UPI002633874B|nr:hypothetical protein [Seonamhaeicola sp.]
MQKLLPIKFLCVIVFLINTVNAQDSIENDMAHLLEISNDITDLSNNGSVSINFNNASPLTATDLSDVRPGEKVVYSKALKFQNKYYDLVLTILRIKGAYTVDCNNELRVSTFDSSKDNYVTYSFDLVEIGTATPANPAGKRAVLYDVVLESRDIDTRSYRDFTEVSGFNPYTVTSKVTANLSETTNLERAGFVNGPDPSGFILYRLSPALVSPETDWKGEPHDGGDHGDNSDFCLYMEFDQFSHVDLLYGATGTDAHTWVRLTNFGMSTKSGFNKNLVVEAVENPNNIGYNPDTNVNTVTTANNN